jgi:negative regulator of replication initiation
MSAERLREFVAAQRPRVELTDDELTTLACDWRMTAQTQEIGNTASAQFRRMLAEARQAKEAAAKHSG